MKTNARMRRFFPFTILRILRKEILIAPEGTLRTVMMGEEGQIRVTTEITSKWTFELNKSVWMRVERGRVGADTYIHIRNKDTSDRRKRQ